VSYTRAALCSLGRRKLCNFDKAEVYLYFVGG
jgi:hypothetical protein